MITLFDAIKYLMIIPPQAKSTLFPYTTLFRSIDARMFATCLRHAIRAEVAVFEPAIGVDLAVWRRKRRSNRAGCSGEIGRATSELQSRLHLVCRLLLEKKNTLFDASKHNTHFS